MKTLKIFITGTVQGIFYRNFIKETADSLGVRGYVRNLPDGRVEIVIEGRDDKINEMLEKCRQGPKHSIIKDVSFEEIKYLGLEGFKILNL
jgi:acylphosphatase